MPEKKEKIFLVVLRKVERQNNKPVNIQKNDKRK